MEKTEFTLIFDQDHALSLLAEWRQTESVFAQDRLIAYFANLIRQMMFTYAGALLRTDRDVWDDLYNTCVVGVIKALKSFPAKKPYKIKAYVGKAIYSRIIDFLKEDTMWRQSERDISMAVEDNTPASILEEQEGRDLFTLAAAQSLSSKVFKEQEVASLTKYRLVLYANRDQRLDAAVLDLVKAHPFWRILLSLVPDIDDVCLLRMVWVLGGFRVCLPNVSLLMIQARSVRIYDAAKRGESHRRLATIWGLKHRAIDGIVKRERKRREE